MWNNINTPSKYASQRNSIRTESKRMQTGEWQRKSIGQANEPTNKNTQQKKTTISSHRYCLPITMGFNGNQSNTKNTINQSIRAINANRSHYSLVVPRKKIRQASIQHRWIRVRDTYSVEVVVTNAALVLYLYWYAYLKAFNIQRRERKNNRSNPHPDGRSYGDTRQHF